jgi:DNA-binding transcriptional LysR family regulator
MSPSASTLLNRFTVRAKFRHMQVLVKLAELGSMRRASQAVNMTQPAISQLVSELEKLLETELFFRHARGVKPTDATLELLPVAHRILRALEDGAESVANRLQEKGGVVRILATPAALGGILHERVQTFARRFPDLQIHITQTNEVNPLNSVANASADIICARAPSTIPEGWYFEFCLEDYLVAVCGAPHPLAKSGKVPLDRLGEESWLQNRVGSVARNRFEEISAKENWPRSARCPLTMHVPDLTREMLVTGQYLAILPRSVALPWLNAGDVVELDTEINCDLPPLGFLWDSVNAGTATQKIVAQLTRR